MGLQKNRIAIVDGYGVSISVDSGHLILRNGAFGSADDRVIKISRGRAELDRLLILSHEGMVTLAALDWCNRVGITVAILGSDSRLLNCLIPDQSHDGPIKRAQAVAGTTDDALRLARWLLAKKIDSQIVALEHDLARFGLFKDREVERVQSVTDLRRCSQSLELDTTLVALLSREAQAAQSYWRMLAGTLLPWPDWAKRRVPEHWTRISPRATGRRLMREATDPFNAMLNYGYTLLEVEGRVACAASGLDPDLGLLHVDDRLRESFIYDLIEPVRAKVDALTLEFSQRKGLRPWMFHELRDGVVRLDPDLARDLAQYLMPKLRKPTIDVAAAYVEQLRRVKVSYALERPSRFFAPTVKRPAGLTHCEYCKKPLPRKGLKFCGRECYLKHSVEVRQPIKLAQARLAEMRAQGLSPGHGGEAAKKRGAKIAQSNRRRLGEKRPPREQ